MIDLSDPEVLKAGIFNLLFLVIAGAVLFSPNVSGLLRAVAGIMFAALLVAIGTLITMIVTDSSSVFHQAQEIRNYSVMVYFGCIGLLVVGYIVGRIANLAQ